MKLQFSSSQDASIRWIRTDKMAFRRIADEVLLVPIRQNADEKTGIFTLNPSAARIWELMDGSHSVQEIVAAISAEFDADPAQVHLDVSILADDLVKIGAIALIEKSE